jgi:DUF2075 family protein
VKNENYDSNDKNSSKWEREPFEIKVFDSPIELYNAIAQKAKESRNTDKAAGKGISRVLATYDWPYSAASKPKDQPNGMWNVQLHRDSDRNWQMGAPVNGGKADSEYFCMPWNYQLPDPDPVRKTNSETVWAEKDFTLDEVGSTFTIQGFDLNCVGVIIGPSVKYRGREIFFDRSASANKLATNKRHGTKDYSAQNLRNELNVLLKRGVHGLYLFAVDEELRETLALHMQKTQIKGNLS